MTILKIMTNIVNNNGYYNLKGEKSSSDSQIQQPKLSGIVKDSSARTADMAVNRIRDTIGLMKPELQSIKKHYPPFPYGSEERIELINSFNSLRRLIKKLTIPPEEPGYADMSEVTVKLKSMEVRDTLTIESTRTVTKVHSQLLSLL